MEGTVSNSETLNEATPALTVTIKESETTESVVRDDAISSTTSDKYLDTPKNNTVSDSDAEADFLEAELNITNIASEKITENVEDIVQDLENLLGESSDYYGREANDVKLSQSHSEIDSIKVDKLENENETQLVSSQEVTSADASVTVTGDFKNVDTNEVVESTIPIQSKADEYDEGVIVDSTDTKTDELCEAQHELRSQDLNQCEASKSEIEGSKSECHLPMVDTPATECDDVSKHSEELIDNQQNISIGSETAEENADKTQYDEAIQCETTSEVTLEVLQETSQVDEVPPSDQLERGVETTSEEIVAQVNEAESISLSQSDQEKESGAPQVIVTEDVVTTGIVENEMKLSPEEAHTSAQINDCVPLNLCESGSVSEAVGVSNELNEIENVPIPFQNKVDVTPEVRPEPITELNQINEADSISLPLDLQNTVSKDELETNTMEGLETLQLPVIEKCAEVTTSQCEEIEFDKPESVEMQHGANQAEVLCDGEEMLKKSINEMEFLNTDAVPPFINQVIDELSRSTNMDDAASIDLQKIEMHDLPVDVQYINQTENTPLDVDMSETLRPDYLCEDVSELDLACKSIQMVSEKMDIDLPQHDLCSSQFLDIPPDENMSEQSIAIASIMNEMGEGESEVSSMLNLEDSSSVPFPNLTDNEPLPEFICHDKLELENTQSTEDVMALSSEVNVELSQPLTVEVGESSLPATEQTQEMEEPSQSDRASLKMTITKTDNVHSILKIYDPDESNLEVVDPIPKLTETSSNPDEVPTTTSELLQTEVSPNAKIGNKTPEYKMEDHSIGSTVNSDTISTNLGKGNNLEANEKSAVDSRILEEHIQHHIEEKNVDVKPNPHENIGFMQKQEATHSPRITIKPLVKPVDTLQGISSPKHVILKPEEAEKESLKITLKSLLKSSSEAHYVPDKYSPKITIKPVIKPIEQPPFEIEKPTKVTIKPVLKVAESDYHPEDRHGRKISIKPIRKPTEPEEFQNTRLTMKTIPHLPEENEEQRPSPKITIKPIMKPLEEIVDHYSTRVKTKFSNELESYTEERHSPKITIKPIPKPNDEYHIQHDEKHNTKLIIKPILRTDFENLPEDRPSPKITIKPLKPPDDMQISVEDVHGAKVTIKPIPKDDMDEKSAPRITIKPILKPEEYPETSNPRITIKPIMKPQEHFERFDDAGTPFKLNIKPVMRPVECSLSPKITIKPVPKVEPFDPMELIDFEEQIKQERIVLKIPKNRKVENERVKKIKVKLSKDHGVAQILPMKRPSSEGIECETKHIKMEAPSDLSISVISNAQAISEIKHEDVNIKKVAVAQDDDIVDPLSEIPVFEITLESASAMSAVQKPTLPLPISVPPTPRKRGRPRKVPLEVREEFKDTKEEVVLLEVNESSRPKRSCRGPSVRATLGIRPRKPRGRGRGRPPGSRSAKKVPVKEKF